MKVGIFGGSFDPPHIGHESMVNEIEKSGGLDEIWLMPCFIHPFGKKISSPKLRIAMAKFLAKGNVLVSDFEVNRKGVSYSIETLKALSREFPNDNFYWIISFSELKDFHKWKDWEIIVKKYGLIIYSRGVKKTEAEKAIKECLKIKKIPGNIQIVFGGKKHRNVSSTEIRHKVKSGISTDGMLDEKVKSFIIKGNLYNE